MSGELNLTYEKHFSPRADGRYVCTMAAHMAMLRELTPRLALPEELTEGSFAAWQKDIKEALRKQLRMPQATPQPAPVKLSSVQRDGYRVEKWEFYPDDYTVVPFLALIPDGACAEKPVPAVMYYLGDEDSKESAAGEPELAHPNCAAANADPAALALVRGGMTAFVFETPGFGECSVMSDPALGQTQQYIREILCHGLLETGMGYVGLTVFQRLQFAKWLSCFDFVDQDKLAICAQGLGTESAVATGLLCEQVKGLILRTPLHDDRALYANGTEQPGRVMTQDVGKWHILPGKMTTFSYHDLCAAFAPRFLALAEIPDTVQRAYTFCGADAQDLSQDPAAMLKTCFGMD